VKGPRFDARVVTALVVTVVFWASSYASIRVGLQGYGPGQVALFRLGAASVVLAGYAAVTRMRMPDLRDLPAIAGLGFLAFTFYHAALNYGELTVASGPAGVLIATAAALDKLLRKSAELAPKGFVTGSARSMRPRRTSWSPGASRVG
jgi:drug/metabolite transporter (DMT)-like permease